MCGAVSGGIMALGLCHGRKRPDESRDKCYTSVQKLLRMFEDRFGSTNCRELTGFDLGTKKGRREFKAQNTIEKCREFTEEATRMTMSIIIQMNPTAWN
jgi:C_GCAxxG_C_C family probable redox protein